LKRRRREPVASERVKQLRIDRRVPFQSAIKALA
jgi:hypothetical protein